jgi:DNA-binding transcriptional LysR family regulator
MQTDPSRLPPLDLIVTFEAAARLLSFTRAAQERFVTQSAVSRQMRALEEDLGVALFRRGHRALTLTDEGHQLYGVCRRMLEGLRDSVGRLRAPARREVLTVTTTPGLAALWLIPRLADFTGRHPGIDVRVDATFARRDLRADGIDVAIRYAMAASADGERLFGEEFLPVCSPTLPAAGNPLETPADLVRHTLLRMSDPIGPPTDEWEVWLQAVGVPGLQPGATLSFSNYSEVISAATLGQGVAMGRRPLVDALLASGALVVPFTGRLASPRAYFVQVAERSAPKPSARALRDWLLDQAGTS